jgi:putative endopeptidase
MRKLFSTSIMFVFALQVLGSNGHPAKKLPKKRKFIDAANMDRSVKPGDNFYLYANGNWIKNNPIPASKTRWGSFDELRELSSSRLRGMLQEAAAKAATDKAMQKIGDFYTSGMDSLAIENLGYKPIQPQLEKINAINSVDALLTEMAIMHTNGNGSLYGFFIGQDRKNVTKYIVQLSQGGTSLPDRDYYLKDDARSKSIRKAFAENITQLFKLINDANPAKSADAVIRIETALAKAQMSRVEMRDPYKTYNKFAVNDFNVTTPSVNWGNQFKNLGLTGVDSLLVNNPAFFKMVDALLTALPLEDWKTYARWNILKAAAPSLSNNFVEANFKLNQVLTGQKQQTPRWQRMSSLIDGSMGDLLGELYVNKYFKPEAKARMLELVNNLQQTFQNRIQQLEWMSDETKVKALEKLNAFTKKIGYPDKWKDYGSITISKNNFFENVTAANKWSYNEMISMLGKPVDKTRWGMTPPTINAYYSPTNNEIAFPAGILQFPFFDFGADDAVNYGGIGAVIGHEMTHGFDDQGRQYAADGNLKDWWLKTDADKFKNKADEVVAQYNNFTVLDTLHVNGKLTLGENLADLGGLAIAYDAFTKTKQFKEGKKIDGFTPTQRFFLSWAQVWRNNALPETQAQLILTDPHSPGMHRANGPLVNMNEWYAAFGVTETDKMYKPQEKRTRIW